MGRGFTEEEIERAHQMRRDGMNFAAIARALGRKSSDGIRRILDPDYHLHRNRYQQLWARRRRSGQETKDKKIVTEW